jgi:hypothetical protein
MRGAAILLADTGIILGLLDRGDEWHARARAAWEQHGDTVVVPAPVVVEVCYLLGRQIGAHAEQAFLASVARGEFVIRELEDQDYARAASLMAAYLDTPLGFVDASIVAMAERLGVIRILTTDRRHFGLVRPSHIPAFELVP